MENLNVKQIKAITDDLKEEEYLKYIALLVKDKRESVKKIAVSLSKKLDNIKRESDRLEKLFEIEKDILTMESANVAGIDEAGRGPLAGPVVAACVILKEKPDILKIDDSKKINEKTREEIFEQIKGSGIIYGIGIADNNEIDRYNIWEATMLAMRRAIAMADETPAIVLVDGNQNIKGIDIPQRTVIQGDSKCISIACASIIAKVTRDRLMYEYAKIYKMYGFEKHKGYGTREHMDIIKELGPTPIHRISFLKNIF